MSDRYRDALEDVVDTLEAMDLHVDNSLYDRIRAALEAPTQRIEADDEILAGKLRAWANYLCDLQDNMLAHDADMIMDPVKEPEIIAIEMRAAAEALSPTPIKGET